MRRFPTPSDRGWIAVGLYLLTIGIFVLMWRDPELRQDEFFRNLSLLVVGTGLINGVVGYAFNASGSVADAQPMRTRA